MKFRESNRKRLYFHWKKSNLNGTLMQFLTSLDGCGDVCDADVTDINNAGVDDISKDNSDYDLWGKA